MPALTRVLLALTLALTVITAQAQAEVQPSSTRDLQIGNDAEPHVHELHIPYELIIDVPVAHAGNHRRAESDVSLRDADLADLLEDTHIKTHEPAKQHWHRRHARDSAAREWHVAMHPRDRKGKEKEKEKERGVKRRVHSRTAAVAHHPSDLKTPTPTATPRPTPTNAKQPTNSNEKQDNRNAEENDFLPLRLPPLRIPLPIALPTLLPGVVPIPLRRDDESRPDDDDDGEARGHIRMRDGSKEGLYRRGRRGIPAVRQDGDDHQDLRFSISFTDDISNDGIKLGATTTITATATSAHRTQSPDDLVRSHTFAPTRTRSGLPAWVTEPRAQLPDEHGRGRGRGRGKGKGGKGGKDDKQEGEGKHGKGRGKHIEEEKEHGEARHEDDGVTPPGLTATTAFTTDALSTTIVGDDPHASTARFAATTIDTHTPRPTSTPWLTPQNQELKAEMDTTTADVDIAPHQQQRTGVVAAIASAVLAFIILVAGVFMWRRKHKKPFHRLPTMSHLPPPANSPSLTSLTSKKPTLKFNDEKRLELPFHSTPALNDVMGNEWSPISPIEPPRGAKGRGLVWPDVQVGRGEVAGRRT
ncbi:uncharacterized protein EV422DRAFT_620782 [Fimicolochytrium jonesii]|uniref:uncharacterized protein n=1 Tax=Fimicolochytrium jonesii TaxID=1396493 RepID=UPI0022FE66F6|nr:uncharacterized protein EV422DRAFT_620782 [Fimicolochytrium jonesii]KAI8819935.1 hypothetical protein EV422DRAFT_620782 [Fimicolochytrium jonesii]